jgi:hypothetical protein
LNQLSKRLVIALNVFKYVERVRSIKPVSAIAKVGG